MKNFYKSNRIFANLNRAFNNLNSGMHINFLDDNRVKHAVVISKWQGKYNRLVVKDDNGTTHYLKDLSQITILDHKSGVYVSAAAFGSYFV